jgi:hypothetical protein
MILIGEEQGLSVEVCNKTNNGTYHVRFQEHERSDGGSWKPSEPGFFLPTEVIEPLISKLEEAREILALVEHFNRPCTISLEGHPAWIEIDDETGLMAEVSGGGYLGEFLVYFKLMKRRKPGYWTEDDSCFCVPANAIEHFIAKLGQAKEDKENT